MNGTFDEEVRAAMRLAKGETPQERQQNARDQVARRMNVAAGNGMSTAYPNAQAAQQQQVAPTPSPRPSNIDQSIDAQLADAPPIPTARPNANAMPMGDASVMEAMQGAMPNAQPQQMAAPAAQQGDAQVAEAMSPRPQQGPPAPQTAQGGVDPNMIAAVVASLGGAAGVAALIQRARMGDADAARTFEAIGMHPEDLAMFAGEPLNQRSGRYDYSEAPSKPDADDKPVAAAKGDRASKEKPASEGAPYVGAKPPQWFEDLGKDVPRARPKVKVK